MPPDVASRSDRRRSLPLGIAERHFAARSGRTRSLLTLLLIGGPLVLALLGWLGGGRDSVIVVRSPEAVLTIESPGILRSGNWFETRIAVEPARDIASLAIAIDQSLWRGLSIDTAIPDADSVEALGGRFTYAFGPVRRGERFVFKIDGQVQPRGVRRLSGRVSIADGDRPLAETPVTIMVLP